MTEQTGHPEWPRAGASAAIFRDGAVLLVQRRSGALGGYWSLPGGHIEPGEPARTAALREVYEEAGVQAEIVDLLDIHEVIIGRGGALSAHYLLAVFYGRWIAGEPRPGPDEAAARFVPMADLASYRLTDGAASLINRGIAKLAAAGIS